MLSIKLSKDIEARLEALAKKTGRSKSFFAREAIIEHLADLEDYYLAQERLDSEPSFLTLQESMVDLDIGAEELVDVEEPA